MDSRFFQFLVTLALAEQIWTLPLACSYNGMSYTEGEDVKTEEPCLSCVCRKGVLTCNLRVCADYPDALPPSCFLVHKPDDCCPQLLCEGNFTSNGLEFRTDFQTKSKFGGNECVVNGSIYAEGSAVASSERCEYCYCASGETKCIKPRCIQTFRGCKAVFEKSSCCPTHYDCRGADISFLTAQLQSDVTINTKSKNGLRSLSELDLGGEKNDLNVNETEESEIQTEGATTEVLATTTNTTEETTTADATAVEETETPLLLPEDDPTTLGFQTKETENGTVKSLTDGCDEETTWKPESGTEVLPTAKERNETVMKDKFDFVEGDDANSSQVVYDYDAYDYSEPKLPPSLPNLIIYPFVAADAVVKEEGPETVDVYAGLQLKRIDARPVVYGDRFSPPIKTEGGFVPKGGSPEPFYESSLFGDEQIEKPDAGSKDGFGKNVASPLFNENCLSGDGRIVRQEGCQRCLCVNGAVVCRDEDCSQSEANSSSFSTFVGDPWNIWVAAGRPSNTPDPNDVAITLETESDFLSDGKLTSFWRNQNSKRPVTVTYKNVVVDFYPNFRVTTTRDHMKTTDGKEIFQQPLETKPSEFPPEFSPQTIVSAFPKTERNLISEETPQVTVEGALTKKATSTPTIEQSPLLKEKKVPPIQTATTTEAKLKNFSKTKSHLSTTEIAKEAEESKSSLESKAPGKEETKRLPQFAADGAQTTTRRAVAEPEPPRSGGLSSSESEIHPQPDTLLKLAGCNIYGMMYRIGKVIAELSGPCLECLCTDSGVQCRPLDC